MILVEHGDSIGADHLLERQLDGGLEVHVAVDLGIFDELDQHLGIGI